MILRAQTVRDSLPKDFEVALINGKNTSATNRIGIKNL